MTTVAHDPRVQPLLDRAAAYLPAEKVRLVEEAYDFAAECHDGQMRLTGDPYIVHPLDAALTVAEPAARRRGDRRRAAARRAGGLRRAATPRSRSRFGADVAKLVDGVTKLDKINLAARRTTGRATSGAGREPAQDVPGDGGGHPRRHHQAGRPPAQHAHARRASRRRSSVRIAQETMEIYAPLANRLGIWQIKWELEDLCVPLPGAGASTADRRAARSRSATAASATSRRSRSSCDDELETHGIKAEVTGRAKHIYSIHQKMREVRGRAQDRSTRSTTCSRCACIVDTVADCYHALGVVHGLWRPLPGQFDDYIANPKESMYQSLHTTVMALGARPLEIQIRTHEMHQLAEYGVAAHWRYKEGAHASDARFEERIDLAAPAARLAARDRRTPRSSSSPSRPTSSSDQVFVYTPKGEIKELPAGATPIDFAYRIHTDLGHHCVGAKVNGRLVPLNYKLQNGDVVEIVAGEELTRPVARLAQPEPGLCQDRRTRARRSASGSSARSAPRTSSAAARCWSKELRRLEPVALRERQDEMLKIFKYDTLDDFLAALGYGGVSTGAHRRRGSRRSSTRTRSRSCRAPEAAAPPRDVRRTACRCSAPATCSRRSRAAATRCPATRSSATSRAPAASPSTAPTATTSSTKTSSERLVDVEWGRTRRSSTRSPCTSRRGTASACCATSRRSSPTRRST